MKFWSIVKYLIFTIITIFILLSIAVGIVVNFVFTPEKLTPKIEEVMQGYFNSEISIGKVDITAFSTFPKVSVRVDSVRVRQLNSDSEDLLSAEYCVVTMNPVALLDKEVRVDEILLHKPAIRLYVDSLVSPVAHLKFESDTTTVEKVEAADTLNKFRLRDYQISIDKVRIDSSDIVIDDRLKDCYARAHNLSVGMRVEMDSLIAKLGTRVQVEQIDARVREKNFATKTSIGFGVKMNYQPDSLLLTIERNKFKVNDIEIVTGGTLRGDRERKSLIVNYQCSLSTPSIEEFLKLVPSYIFDQKEQVTTSGNVDFKVVAKGEYSKTIYPEITGNLTIKDGKASFENRRLALEAINCDADMLLDLNTPRNSYAKINNLHLNTSGILDIKISGAVDEPLIDPKIDIQLYSDIDFDRFTELFPLKDVITLKGHNISDLKAKFTLSDMQQGNYGKIFINGVSSFNQVAINFDGSKIPRDTTKVDSLGYDKTFMDVKIEKGSVKFGDNVRANKSRTLLANVDFSNVGFQDKYGLRTSMTNLVLAAGANFDTKTSKVNGVGVKATVQGGEFSQNEELDVKFSTTEALLTITPKTESQRTRIVSDIKSAKIVARSAINNSNIDVNTARLKLTMKRNGHRDWSLYGGVGFKDLNLDSEIFPLKIEVPSTLLTINENKMDLRNAKMKLGESEIVATGYITNLIRVFFIDPKTKMEGQLKITSPYLNVSELMEATNNSPLMSDVEIEEEVDETTQSTNITINSSVTQSQQTANESVSMVEKEFPDDSVSMFIVPRGVDFDFDVDITKLKYDDTTVENVVGKASVKRGALSLEKLTLNAIGADAYTSLRYRNIGRKKSSLLFSLQLHDVDINRIGELLPTVAEVIPAMGSLEGVVDFHIKARTNVDKDMNIIMDSFKGASSLNGTDLVLMDSETFADISKTLMFKNKERNIIDSLSLYIIGDKSKFTILPFSITMDRYSAIIGGEQNVELKPESVSVDYSYNISIMKSPLPFKAGIDITGRNEEYKYRITKAKLKKTNFDEQKEIYEKHRSSIEIESGARDHKRGRKGDKTPPKEGDSIRRERVQREPRGNEQEERTEVVSREPKDNE